MLTFSTSLFPTFLTYFSSNNFFISATPLKWPLSVYCDFLAFTANSVIDLQFSSRPPSWEHWGQQVDRTIFLEVLVTWLPSSILFQLSSLSTFSFSSSLAGSSSPSQGLVLGLIFFSIYTHDLGNLIRLHLIKSDSDTCKFHMRVSSPSPLPKHQTHVFDILPKSFANVSWASQMSHD